MNIRSGKKELLSLAMAVLLVNAGCGMIKDDSATVIIRVNSRAITAGEYRDALKRLLPEEQGQDKDELMELKKELISEMVEEELLLDEAGRANIEVGEGELSSEVDLMRKEYGEGAFKEAIEERYGSVDGWQERIRRKLLIRKTIERISSGAAATEAEAQKYYRENPGEFSLPEQVRARMIVVSTEEAAALIRGRLTPGNFAEVAKAESLSPDAKDGGDLGWFGREDMPNDFSDVVFNLKPGGISPVVKTTYGFHIFLLEGRRKGGRQKYPEVREKIMERLGNERAAQRLNDWIETAKRNSKIEVREDLL